MPIYEYSCPDCGHNFEELVLGSSPQIKCPRCGGETCHKLMSAASFRSPGGERGASSSGSGCSGCSASSCAGCGR